MAVQGASDYQINHPASVNGAIVDGTTSISKSRLAEEDLPFGRAVVRGTDAENEVALPTPGDLATSFMGVVQRVQDDVADANDVLEVKAGKEATIADFAEIWVEVEDAVVAGGAAFARVAAGNLGLFRSDADGGDAEAVPNAVYDSAAAAGGHAKLRVRIV